MRLRMMILAGALLVPGCGEETGGGGSDGGTSGGMDATTAGMDAAPGPTDGSVPVDSPFTVDPGGRVTCADGEPCACDNGVDDDGDGLVDGLDPECTGPYDDDEGSFSTGIPGDNIDFCQDCFFDGNSGNEEGCAYHTDCLYGREPPPRGGAACFSCEVSDECIMNCRSRTPNGCDCFGCCAVTRDDGSTVNVILDSDCSLATIDDEDACPRCVQNTDCVNECGECELCPGREVSDLPAHCFAEDGGTTGYTCDDGEQVCGDGMPCPTGQYCQLGCCLEGLI